MIPADCKRLIEVDFPIAAVSAQSAREKSGPQGHISTVHLWWARRPLAACRAVLLGLLLPDPCDKECPATFKTAARGLLAKRYGSVTKSDEELRELLLKFIGEFADWDHAANALYLEIGRGLIKAAHPEETPVVVDPFAGGGSIPLEALRLGCEVFASDLNPVACLILKTLLEDIPRYGNAEFRLPDGKSKEIVVHGLADALRHVGKQVKAAAEKELAPFYPPDPDGSRPIAYLWARTVRCEGIGCGAEIPLLRSFWLARKDGRNQALRYRVERPKGKTPFLVWEIFEPRSEAEVPARTVNRAKATCPCCNVVLPAERVRSQLTAKQGGSVVEIDDTGQRSGGALMLAVVSTADKRTGRIYRLPRLADYKIVSAAAQAAKKLISTIPNEPTPVGGGKGASRAFSIQKYGMMCWGDLFLPRQKLALATLRKHVQDVLENHSLCLAEPLTLALSRVAMCGMTLTNWNAHAEKMQHTFGRQALPIVWDFAEVVPIANAPGAWPNALELVCEVAAKFPASSVFGEVQICSATQLPLPDASVAAFFSDPPYYDAVPYADLSDFFFVWLKRTLPGHPLLRDPFDPSNSLTPKEQEIVQDETKKVNGVPKDRAFFEQKMGEAFAEGRRVLKPDGIACVVFAHKTTEGWEALLSGMIAGGWTISASWPISTEMASRLRARDSAALAGSVHLVCRPRNANAAMGDWSEVKAAMERRIREWLPTLLKHGVRGADAIFSCLGPALESYSKFEKVLTAADREVPLGGDPGATEPHERGFLAYVFETLSKEALRQVLGDAQTEGFEEDARMTALFLWTLQSTKSDSNGAAAAAAKGNATKEDESEPDEEEGKPKKKAGFTMPFDTFIRITRPMGIHYAALERSVIEIEKGVVRLLPVRERMEQLLGEAAERHIERISIHDFRQLELGLLEKRKSETAFPTKRSRSKAPRSELVDEVTFTTLDRLHRSMLLFNLGRSTLLRQLLEDEMRQGKRFERLALALNALYPEGSDERRMLEGVQAAMRGVK